MVSLQNFPNLPKHGEVSICEKDGRICSLPINEINVSQISTTVSFCLVFSLTPKKYKIFCLSAQKLSRNKYKS